MKKIVHFGLSLIFSIFLTSNVFAATATWDANPENDLAVVKFNPGGKKLVTIPCSNH